MADTDDAGGGADSPLGVALSMWRVLRQNQPTKDTAADSLEWQFELFKQCRSAARGGVYDLHKLK